MWFSEPWKTIILLYISGGSVMSLDIRKCSFGWVAELWCLCVDYIHNEAHGLSRLCLFAYLNRGTLLNALLITLGCQLRCWMSLVLISDQKVGWHLHVHVGGLHVQYMYVIHCTAHLDTLEVGAYIHVLVLFRSSLFPLFRVWVILVVWFNNFVCCSNPYGIMMYNQRQALHVNVCMYMYSTCIYSISAFYNYSLV